MEQALAESESRFRRIYDSNMIGISYWNQNGKIADANQAYLDMIGYSRQDLKTQDLRWNEITPEEYTSTDQEAMREIRAKGYCTPYEKEYIRKDESRIPVLIGGASLEGERYLGLTYAIDISERKKAMQQSEERRMYLESILKAAPDAIITMDADQKIVEWNPGAEELFGYRAQESVGKQLDDLITREEVQEEAHRYTQLAQKGHELPATETVRYRKDRTPVEVILAGSPIMVDGEMIGAIGVYTDISDRVRMEYV